MNLKEFIENVTSFTKNLIEKFEGYENLSGEQKKARVDETIEKYILSVIDTLGLNFIVKFILKKILLDNIPTITQCIFDLLKDKIKGITK